MHNEVGKKVCVLCYICFDKGANASSAKALRRKVSMQLVYLMALYLLNKT